MKYSVTNFQKSIYDNVQKCKQNWSDNKNILPYIEDTKNPCKSISTHHFALFLVDSAAWNIFQKRNKRKASNATATNLKPKIVLDRRQAAIYIHRKKNNQGGMPCLGMGNVSTKTS